MAMIRKRLILKLLLISAVLISVGVIIPSWTRESRELDKVLAAREDDYRKVAVIQGFGPPIENADESLGMENDSPLDVENQNSNKNLSAHSEVLINGISMLEQHKAIYRTSLDSSYPGELGKAVIIHKNKLTSQERKLLSEGWKNNAFNEFVSNKISIHRTLPAVADAACLKQTYNVDELPDASVVICFHNEAWSVLLRTVHSVLERTPAQLLKEIILVDDFSNRDYLNQPLVDYMAKFPKVKIIRMPKREGLIRARLKGAEITTAEALVYLDSHCECVENWLQPLLQRIKSNRHTVVCPVIDVIDDNTFEYHYSKAYFTNVGGFDWSLQFNWHSIPERERKKRKHDIDPVASPTMAGGLFAINKEFFYHLGAYDPGFDIWGGENLELSFKIWMCGGKLEIVPCSHVGHIFRKRSPYKWRSGVNVLKRNTVRLAEVWLDDYKQYYYERINNKLGDFGDVKDRKLLRQKLNCTSFKWYLDNIYPELFVPGEAIASGEIRNMGGGSKMCLDWGPIKKGASKGSRAELYWCHQQGGNQYWMYSKDGEIRRDDSCLDYAGQDVMVFGCHGMKGNQKWKYDDKLKRILHDITGKCLEMAADGARLEMNSCDSKNSYQQWVFKTFNEEKAKELI